MAAPLLGTLTSRTGKEGIITMSISSTCRPGVSRFSRVAVS